MFGDADRDVFLADMGVDVVFGSTTVKGLYRIGPQTLSDGGGALYEFNGETVLIKTGALLARLLAPAALVPGTFFFGGPLGIGVYQYRVTFVTASGETDGGVIASVTTVGGGAARIGLTGVPTGSSAVTARKIYRTVVNGSAFKLAITLNDNTTTVVAEDTVADGSLGAACPTANTSGLGEASALTVNGTSYKVRQTHPDVPDSAMTRLVLVR